jgi:hypothetical protein
MPEPAERLRAIQALADIWGALYLFHPWIGQRVSQRDWDQVFITALPQVEQAGPAAVLATLQAQVVQPLADRLPSVQGFFVGSPYGRVHEGWNEDGYPYVFGRQWKTGAGAPSSPCGPEQPPCAPGQPATTVLSRAERILGLCKVWTVLRCFAPQLAASELDPEALLPDWLARIEAATSLEAYYRVLADIAARLTDRHARVVAPADSLPEEAAHEDPATGRPSRRAPRKGSWLGGLRYLRPLTDNLVYMTPFAMPDAASLKETFALIQNTRGLVLELRGYPRTHFQHELVRCLCQRPVPSPRYEIPVIGEPDLRKRTWKVVQYQVQPDGRTVYTQPVVALIDGTTQSSAEDFCMYLKIAGRVTFVGRRTAGCVGNATYVNLPGGGRFTFTGMRVTWPDGSPMWGIGILPDVPVEARRAGRDEILAHGLEVLQALRTR